MIIESMVLEGIPRVHHGFFGRGGGVSSGLYESLNCGPGSNDAPPNVAENRARALAALGLKGATLVSLYQVHSARALYVSEPWTRETAPEADGMVTDRPGIALGVLAADCAPILFADGGRPLVGACHAGWKGAKAGIIEATLEEMRARGGEPERIAAVIGPCISRAAYEVGPEFRAGFLADDSETARFFEAADAPGKFRFDLPGYCAARLIAAGLSPMRIERLDRCTWSEPKRFFSYRRTTQAGAPDYGRNLSAIALAG